MDGSNSGGAANLRPVRGWPAESTVFTAHVAADGSVQVMEGRVSSTTSSGVWAYSKDGKGILHDYSGKRATFPFAPLALQATPAEAVEHLKLVLAQEEAQALQALEAIRRKLRTAEAWRAAP